MKHLNLIQCLIIGLLLFAYSFVSYRITKSLRKSYAAGLFRHFANVPLVQLIILLGASPFLLLERYQNKAKHSQDDAAYIANIQSKIFHRRDCEYAQSMGQQKRLELTDINEAKQKGFRPCNNCKP